MSFDSLMNKKAIVKRKTRSRDAYGTMTEVEKVLYSGMPVRIQPLGGREMSIYDAERVEATHRAFAPASFKNVREDDVLYIDSEKYDVELIRNVDLMDHHLEMDLRCIKEGT